MLEKMYKRQKDFQKNFFNPDKLTDKERQFWTKEFVLATHQELTEVMQSVDWKKYHVYRKKYAIENTREEIIDCFKFILNLMIVWGIDTTMLYKIFERKSKLVELRLKKHGKQK